MVYIINVKKLQTLKRYIYYYNLKIFPYDTGYIYNNLIDSELNILKKSFNNDNIIVYDNIINYRYHTQSHNNLRSQAVASADMRAAVGSKLPSDMHKENSFQNIYMNKCENEKEFYIRKIKFKKIKRFSIYFITNSNNDFYESYILVCNKKYKSYLVDLRFNKDFLFENDTMKEKIEIDMINILIEKARKNKIKKYF